MNLTSWSDLVKPQRAVLTVAAVTTLVSVLAFLVVARATDQTEARAQRFGSTAARALAALAAEPLMQQDRLHLGVIGNRLAELPEVTGVASLSADLQILASTGDLTGPQFTLPVTMNGGVVGHVRVAVNVEAFAEPQNTWAAVAVLALLLIPLGVGAGFALAGAVRRGELRGLLPSVPTWPRSRSSPQVPVEPAVIEEEAEPLPAPDIRHYLLAVNLYNQLTLPPTEREFELSLCLELAESVAERYQGQVVALPGVGVLLDFDHTDDEDRPFQVLCAAFLLSRLLRDEAPFGTYRLGLNLTEKPADEALPLDDEAITDAALLSALARSQTLAVSAPFAGVLSEPQRACSQPLVNPLLDELLTSSASCQLVTGLESPHAEQVARQAELLRSQRDAISSPSTF